MNDLLSNLPSIGQYVTLATGILVIVGGVIGFVKAQSKASLIAGTISGLVAIGAFGLTFVDMKVGTIAALIVMGLLQVVFGIRLKKTKKFMPAGLMIIIVGMTELVLLLSIIHQFGLL